MPTNQVLVGDAVTELRQLPDANVDMVLTSPPYFRLRDYAAVGQIGIEATVTDWVSQLQVVCAELHRVLVPTGTLWLNLGDSYATHYSQGTGRKSLLLGPERLAGTLLADGWLLRNKVVWQKANPMPSSVRDRLTCSWEVIYVLAKQPNYFFDLDAIRQPHRSRGRAQRRAMPNRPAQREAWRGPNGASVDGLARLKAEGRPRHPLGKNPADVWRFATSSYRGGHHATFPVSLATRAISAGCPEARCRRCCLPWRRSVVRSLDQPTSRGPLQPGCSCPPTPEAATVLDPFFGSGTTGLAAKQLGRNWLGIELNPGFAAQAEQRLHPARVGPP